MGRFLAGAVTAALLLLAGWLLWRGAAESDVATVAALPAPPPPRALDLPMPAADAPTRGAPPPEVPEAPSATREERRFNRYDRNRDERITRIEMLSTRTNAFRKLDRDGNNLLTFEEWAAATSGRFAGADANRDGWLTRGEFTTTAPKRGDKPDCRC